ncbi:MAG: hypothetical protein HND48_23885 [Chloroflexi bacterium]|nr:hypothetical protein [Chloroflexota bacterium]
MTEVREPDQWPEVIDRVLARDYWIEQRMMLAVVLRDGVSIAEAERAQRRSRVGRRRRPHDPA